MSVVSTAPRAASFVRCGLALAMGGGKRSEAVAIAEGRNWNATAMALKAATEPLGRDDLGVSLADTGGLEFVGMVREVSVLGRMRGVKKVPFATRLAVSGTGPSSDWIGEKRPAKVVQLTLTAGALSELKVGFLTVFSDELAKGIGTAGTTFLRDFLVSGLAEAIDYALLNPANAGVDGIVPASILSGVAGIAPGATAADDLAALIAAFTGNLATAYLIASPARLASLTSADRPDVGVKGGQISQITALPSLVIGDILVLVDASALVVAEGEPLVGTSKAASVQMSDSPDDGPSTSVSLWQSNLLSMRVLQSANWRLVRPGCAVFIDYGA